MQKCNQPSQFEKFLMLLLLASFVYAMLLAAKYERITTSLIIWVVFILVTIAMITMTMCGTQALQQIRNFMPQFPQRQPPPPVETPYATVADMNEKPAVEPTAAEPTAAEPTLAEIKKGML
jgi:hypothetical protein